MIRRLVLAATIFQCAAHAVQPASDSNRAVIANYINEANRITNEELPGTLALLESQRAKISPNRALIAELEREARRLTNRRNIAMTATAKLAIVAYDLSAPDPNGLPINRRGTAVHPSMRGRQATWVVTYQGESRDRQALDARGRPIRLPSVQNALGQTGVDGYTTLHGTFESPEQLALVLHHELAHFDLYTTRGKGDVLGYYEMEVAAYEASAAALDYFGFSTALKSRFRAEIDQGLRENARKALAESRSIRRRLGLVSPLVPATVRPATFISTADQLSQAADKD